MTELCYQFFTCRGEGDVLVLTLTEPEVRGEALCTALREELLEALSPLQAPRVVLDLGQVNYLASLGLAAVLHLRQKLARQGGRLVLCALPPHLTDLLRVTHLSGADRLRHYPIEVATDVTAALARLRRCS